LTRLQKYRDVEIMSVPVVSVVTRCLTLMSDVQLIVCWSGRLVGLRVLMSRWRHDFSSWRDKSSSPRYVLLRVY